MNTRLPSNALEPFGSQISCVFLNHPYRHPRFVSRDGLEYPCPAGGLATSPADSPHARSSEVGLGRMSWGVDSIADATHPAVHR